MGQAAPAVPPGGLLPPAGVGGLGLGAVGVGEVEAEAVAFVVGQAVGLEVADASRDYIHLYHGDSATLTASLDRISRTASSILQGIRVDGKPFPEAA